MKNSPHSAGTLVPVSYTDAWDRFGIFTGQNLTAKSRKALVRTALLLFPDKDHKEIAVHLGVTRQQVSGIVTDIRRQAMKEGYWAGLAASPPETAQPVAQEAAKPEAEASTAIKLPFENAWAHACVHNEDAWSRFIYFLGHLNRYVQYRGRGVLWIHATTLSNISGLPVLECRTLIKAAVYQGILREVDRQRYRTAVGGWGQTIYYRFHDPKEKEEGRENQTH